MDTQLPQDIMTKKFLWCRISFRSSAPFLFGGKAMSEYQLEIKQIVDYPRCRIYSRPMPCFEKAKL